MVADPHRAAGSAVSQAASGSASWEGATRDAPGAQAATPAKAGS